MLYIKVKIKELPIGVFSHRPTMELHGERISLRERIDCASRTTNIGTTYLNFSAESMDRFPFSQWIPENGICMVEI